MKKIKVTTKEVVDCKTIEIHKEVYNKLESWKTKVFPYGCEWTTFINHLVKENEQRHLDDTPNRIEQLKLLDEETYLRKTMERRTKIFHEEVAD